MPFFLLVAAAACEREPPAPAAPDPQQAAERQCAEASARLEAYLGKKFKAPVPVEMRTRAQLGDFARAQAKRLIPSGLLDVSQKLAERLHEIPSGYDLLEKQVEMVERGAAGFYDADLDRFYVVEGADPRRLGATVAHELVHAYRDVDKDYWPRLLRLAREDFDAAQALHFFVEGDASLVGFTIDAQARGVKPEPLIEQMLRPEAADTLLGDDKTSGIPYAIRATFAATYGEGIRFAAALSRAGGLAALAAAYDRPPRSTEQVLHPDKYLATPPDEPTGFLGGDPCAALGGWLLLHSDVMGEFDVRAILGAELGRPRARAAAAGWDGARYWLCERGDVPLFFGVTSVWDTVTDAREFAQAWADWALRRGGGEGEVGGRGGEWRVETAEGLVVVRQKGTGVLVADGVPPDRAEAVLLAMAAARPVER